MNALCFQVFHGVNLNNKQLQNNVFQNWQGSWRRRTFPRRFYIHNESSIKTVNKKVDVVYFSWKAFELLHLLFCALVCMINLHKLVTQNKFDTNVSFEPCVSKRKFEWCMEKAIVRKTIATIKSKWQLHGHLSQILQFFLMNTADKLLYHRLTKKVESFYSSLIQFSKLLDKRHNGPSISDHLDNLKSNRNLEALVKHRLYFIAENLFQKCSVCWK